MINKQIILQLFYKFDDIFGEDPGPHQNTVQQNAFCVRFQQDFGIISVKV
jgi:hypothetical protein